MNENEIRALYPAVTAENMRGRVLAAVRGNAAPRRRGRLRLSAAVCAVLIAALTLAAGAAAVRGIRILLPRGEEDYVMIRDPATGEWRKEYTYHVQPSGEPAILSDEALHRLTPYIANGGGTLQDAGTRANAEALLGITLHLPAAAASDSRTQLAAYEADGAIFQVNAWVNMEIQTSAGIDRPFVHAQIPLGDGRTGGSVNMIQGSTEGTVYSHALPDGTPAQIILLRTESETADMTFVYLKAAAYYEIDGIIYSFTLRESDQAETMPADAAQLLVSDVRAILDTVR